MYTHAYIYIFTVRAADTRALKKTATPCAYVCAYVCVCALGGSRWQDTTDLEVSQETIASLEQYCSEFLIHAADVEGLCQGIDESLVTKLGEWCTVGCTYAGGVRQHTHALS